MTAVDDTSWSLVRRAAGGEGDARESFARRYEPFVRSYLVSRWKGTPLLGEVDDAVQEVFFDCFREGGVLQRAEEGRGGGFRAFLCGVIRVVERRIAARRGRARERTGEAPEGMEAVEDPRESIGTEIDRAWARRILAEAVERHRGLASRDGEGGARRFRMLEMRFRDDLPPGEVARVLGLDPDRARREYARARKEFEEVFLGVVSFHHPGTPGEVRREARRLLGLLA